MQYLVKVGMDYKVSGKDVRREVGDIASDIPAKSIPWLLEQGAIEEVKEEAPALAEEVEE